MQMNIDEALDIVTEIARENGESMLETMQYMDKNLFQFDSQQRMAFRVAFNEFAKLFAVKE